MRYKEKTFWCVRRCVGTGLPDGPTAKRNFDRRTVEDAGPYR